MAGDWIKMRVDLYRDPKVIAMADILIQKSQPNSNALRNVIRNAVVGALVSVWGVVRTQGKQSGTDLILYGVTTTAIDDIADLPGFGETMREVGWVEVFENGLVFPRFFERHNSEYDKQKQMNRERQARYRERKRQCTGSNVTVTLRNAPREETEKSKEEEKKSKPKEKTVRFKPPTVDEVAAYCRERNNEVNAALFVDFYTTKNWMVGKNKMKDWRAAVRTWEQNGTQQKPKRGGFKQLGDRLKEQGELDG